MDIEIENEGRKTKWDFDLFNEVGAKKMVFSKDQAEHYITRGFCFLKNPCPISTNQTPPNQASLMKCSRCKTPTKANHLVDGICPLCLEDN